MILGAQIGSGRLADVFEDEAGVIKLYKIGVGPELALHEAMVLDALRATPLRVPASHGVSQVDGRWGLRMSRMPGQSLGSLIGVGDLPPLLSRLVELHLEVLACTVTGLPRLKGRLADRLERAANLADDQRSGLLQRLAVLPDAAHLCHGDFHPYNIIVDGQQSGIIDWPDATLGPPEADIARTYMLIALHMPVPAKHYLEAMTQSGRLSRQRVMDWLPIIAGARLAEAVPGEVEQLLSWCQPVG